MNSSSLRHWMAVLVPLLLVVGCSDDDDPAGPTGDTTAPIILNVDPGPDDTGILVDEDITVTFNEAMDPSTATGNVTLSTGSISNLSWTDDENLVISHTDWAEGVEVEVTVGAALADTSGNTLVADFVWDFWTRTASPTVLETSVEDGAMDVSRTVAIEFLFSEPMNLGSLQSSTTVNSLGALMKAPLDFQWFEGDGSKAILRFDEILPASTEIDVSIAASAQTQQGTTLGAPVQFSFTTGTEADTTPPNLVSIVPPSGSIVDPNTTQLVMTFDEPIDPERFEPSMISAQLELAIVPDERAIQWSENGTVLTVPLITPLPAGLPMAVEFASYFDMAGNEQTTPIVYRSDVSGTPDFIPFVDGQTGVWFEEWFENPVEGPSDSGSNEFLVRWEDQGGGEFDRSEYSDPSFEQRWGWETYRRLSDRVDFLGFGEFDEGSSFFVPFSTPVEYARLPFTVDDWAGSTQATTPDGTIDIAYTIEYVGQDDLIAGGFGPMKLAPAAREPQVFWTDSFQAVLEYTFTDAESSAVLATGSQTMWFAPTVGMVQMSSTETDDQGTYGSTEFFVGFYDPQLLR